MHDQAPTPPILTPLTHAQAALLLSGNSLFLDIGKDAPTVLHYGADGDARVLHASGKRDTGRWTLQPDGSYIIDWVDGPKGSASQVRWRAGSIQIFTIAGEPRGRVLRMVPGMVPELE